MRAIVRPMPNHSFLESAKTYKHLVQHRDHVCCCMAVLPEWMADAITERMKDGDYPYAFHDIGHLCLVFNYAHRKLQASIHVLSIDNLSDSLKQVIKEEKPPAYDVIYLICDDDQYGLLKGILGEEGITMVED